jgi:hypothetical protein
MNLPPSLLPKTVERELLERAALLAICPCLYYDLADCIDEMPEDDLVDIVKGKYNVCEVCSEKESAR